MLVFDDIYFDTNESLHLEVRTSIPMCRVWTDRKLEYSRLTPRHILYIHVTTAETFSNSRGRRVRKRDRNDLIIDVNTDTTFPFLCHAMHEITHVTSSSNTHCSVCC